MNPHRINNDPLAKLAMDYGKWKARSVEYRRAGNRDLAKVYASAAGSTYRLWRQMKEDQQWLEVAHRNMVVVRPKQ